MSIEKMIFLYLYICICVISFDTLFNLYCKLEVQREKKKRLIIREMMLQEGQLGIAFLKELKKVSGLKAFHIELLEQNQMESETLNQRWQELCQIFIQLIVSYRKKPSEEKAYLAYVTSILNIGEKAKVDQQLGQIRNKLGQEFIHFLYDDSTYVRDNTLKAVLSLGEVEIVIRALKILDENPERLSEKNLYNALLDFTGAHQALADKLEGLVEEFTPLVQLAIVNYLRLLPSSQVNQNHYFEKFHNLLKEENTDKEVRLALIRYFGKYYYSAVKQDLVDFIECKDEEKWAFAAVAVKTLESYPEEEMELILQSALCSPSWYVRLNAADSLLAKGFNREFIRKKDRYAYEMLSYREHLREVKEEKR